MTYHGKEAPPNALARNLDYVNVIDNHVEENNTIAKPKGKMGEQERASQDHLALQPTSPEALDRRSLNRANRLIARRIEREKMASFRQEQQKSLESLKRKRNEWGDFEAFGNNDDDNDQDPLRARGRDQEENEHPWMRHDYSQQLTAIEMFTQEIQDFADYLKPTLEERVIRKYVFKAVEELVTGLWSKARVYVFGSFNTQLYLPGSDIDIVMMMKTEKSESEVLRALAERIRSTRFGINVEAILETNVPIVKFQEQRTGIHVDISLNQQDGFTTGNVVQQFLKQMPVLQPMTMLIKQFLKSRPASFCEVFHGGLGSFSVTLLVMSFLQMHPLVQARRIDPLVNLGVLVIEFFELYGLCFNYNTVIISVRHGGSYAYKRGTDRPRSKQLHLTLESPAVNHANVAKGTKKMAIIRESFELAFQELTSAIHRRQRELDRYPRPTPGRPTIPMSSKTIRHQQSMIERVFRLPSHTETNRSEIHALYHEGYFQQKFGELVREPRQDHDDKDMLLIDRGLDKAAVDAILAACRRHFPQRASLTTIKGFAASFEQELVDVATSLEPPRPLLGGAEYEFIIAEIDVLSAVLSTAKTGVPPSKKSKRSNKRPVTDNTINLVTAETVKKWDAQMAELLEIIQNDRIRTVALVMQEAAKQDQGETGETNTMDWGTVATASQQQYVGSLESQAVGLQMISQRVMELFDAMDPNDSQQLTAFLPQYSELMAQQAQFGVRQVEHQEGIVLGPEDRQQLVEWSNSAVSDRLRSMGPIKMAKVEEALPLLISRPKDNQGPGQGTATPRATGNSGGISGSDADLDFYQAQESDGDQNYFELHESDDDEDDPANKYFDDMMREAQDEYGTTDDDDNDKQDGKFISSSSVGAHRDPQNIRSGNDSIQLSQLYSSPKGDHGVSVGSGNSSRYEQLEKMRRRG
ncbi:hypothetical protein EC957_006785 [Mortierella hygrophila]|uniref:polynucleotide adenylyltransferase n=1 Tax=Mortierella hygrophila TaxID=979708 RepID=A0A9P6EZH3_9FUNG|nr:hypothetical protein EC957_006785 [Mortierella hygrophila]